VEETFEIENASVSESASSSDASSFSAAMPDGVGNASSSESASLVTKGDEFVFKRSMTRVRVTLINGDGTVEIQETESQAIDTDKRPIPPRAWSAVTMDQLVEVESH
jgi:hypothetical protein